MQDLFLALFVTGLAFSALSFLLGLGHAHGHVPVHLPHAHPIHPMGHAHAAGDRMDLSPINVSTLAAFTTWFGGIGYLVARYTGIAQLLVLALAAMGGLVGAGVVYVLVTRFLLPMQTAPMRAEDYRIEGTLATVSIPMEGSRTGEVVYSSHGATRSEGARSADGAPLQRGTQVVILRYDRGIAYVESLDRLLAERAAGSTDAASLQRGGEAS